MQSTSFRLNVQRKRDKRSGSVIIEFAMICPVIVLLIFGTIDICSFFYLKQSLKIASYEACRVAVMTGSTDSLARSQATILLDQRNVQGYTITISPDPKTLSRGDFVTVRATAPGGPNLPLKGWFCMTKSTFGETSMMTDR